MHTTLPVPTPETVKAACARFDQENELAEQALAELLRIYPGNADLRGVLLKVVAINSIYHTCIFALDTVARHIHEHHKQIDAALAAGELDVVDRIARVSVKGKTHNFFSFATKFCSWHNPTAYPIYDSHVDHYLWTLQTQDHFASFLHPDLWNYVKFHKIMAEFRSFHGLKKFTFKEIDKFLFLEGAPPKSTAPDPEPCGPGAFDYYPAEELTN
jgi:hypothetical protein